MTGIFHLVAFKSSRVASVVCLRVIIHLHCEASSYQFCSIWCRASLACEQSIDLHSEFNLLSVPLAALYTHCPNSAATMFGTWSDIDEELFFYLLTILLSSHHYTFFPSKSILALMFLNVPSGFHLVVNPLYLHCRL